MAPGHAGGDAGRSPAHMIAELGGVSLALAFALSLAQAVLSGLGRAPGRAVMRRAGEGAAAATFLAVAVAFAALMLAFVRSDFSVLYVAENSHTDKPLIYKIA